MNIVISGATSMSGAFIARELLERNYSVTAVTQTPIGEQQEVVKNRIKDIQGSIRWFDGAPHGSDALKNALSSAKADTYIFHAHPMEGYKTRNYDLGGAVSAIVSNLHQELKTFADAGGTRVIYSGSVFEPNTQLQSSPNVAASIYGISKSMVWETLRLDCQNLGISLDKVTIPNPFGPGEIGRFGNYLVGQWKRSQLPVIQTPAYIRDNIHVRELAVRYADLVKVSEHGGINLRPSGYVESQLTFAKRVSDEFSSRLEENLPIEYLEQLMFTEPRVLINDGSTSNNFHELEKQYWDEYFDSYFNEV